MNELQAILDICRKNAEQYVESFNTKLEKDLLNYSKKNKIPIERIGIKYLLPLVGKIGDSIDIRRYEFFIKEE